MLLPIVTEFQDEVNEIRGVFLAGHETKDVHCRIMPYCPLDDGCLVSLWDAWNRYMRTLYLTSVLGPCTGVSGKRYDPQSPMEEPEAIHQLREAAMRRDSGIPMAGREPKWFVVSAVYSIGECLDLPNVTVIADAVTQSDILLEPGFRVQSPLEEMRVARNYVAHKSIVNAHAVRARMVSGSVDLSDYLRELTRGGATRFDDWADALIGLAWDAAL